MTETGSDWHPVWPPDQRPPEGTPVCTVLADGTEVSGVARVDGLYGPDLALLIEWDDDRLRAWAPDDRKPLGARLLAAFARFDAPLAGDNGDDAPAEAVLLDTPWLLVERNAHPTGDGGCFLTVHSDAEAATEYHDSQPDPADWPIVVLIDLRTGDEYERQDPEYHGGWSRRRVGLGDACDAVRRAIAGDGDLAVAATVLVDLIDPAGGEG